MEDHIFISAQNAEEAEKQVLRNYEARSIWLKPITREDYEAIDKSEREESDNHLILERLDNDETLIGDITYYKFLENRETAFRIDLTNREGKVKKQIFFNTLPREDQ